LSTGTAPTLAPELQDYARAWAKSMAAARPIPGATCEVFSQVPAGAGAYADDDLWITACCSGELAGAVAVRIGRASVHQLITGLVSEEKPATEFSAENKTDLLEWIRSAAAEVAAVMQRKGSEKIEVEFAAEPPDDMAATFWFELQPDVPPLVLELRLDNAIVRSLQSMNPALPASKPAAADMNQTKLGMLMDVELVVAVRFGGRRMLLKDILDLCAGSVVELDQQVQEPVDLLLDGKLFARGEVVVVDGNYGLRVTEVLSSAVK
jgi:flagellar motor switch protein FliN